MTGGRVISVSKMARMRRAVVFIMLVGVSLAGCGKSSDKSGSKEAGNPLDLFTNAISGWEKVKSFRAKMTVTGLVTGATETTMEAVMPDKFHITTSRSEMIIIGKTTYLKPSAGAWRKVTIELDNTFGAMKTMMEDLKVSKEISKTGSETLDGAATEVYESKMTAPALPGAKPGAEPQAYSVKMWVAVSDGMPRKVEQTSQISASRTSIVYKDYNASITIEPPVN